ncbi:MAG TPA: 5-methyltetrahydropteroyltriglutamate--homocysteine S-methyltransferase [Candidatus Binataceae bacterium]|nr:5-methyltetrahydropteroyltriglutamate--homocysteine S-methyltransferase [Candidatus Binataceae bacterium]
MATPDSLRPPFRADVVGSFLRPEALKQAREALLGTQSADQNLGPHDNPELRAIEDGCIREVIAMQERAGLKSVTDGEFRRRSWWLELILGWEGFAANRTANSEVTWRNQAGAQQGFSRLWLTGRIGWRPSAVVRAFEFVQANSRAIPKVTMPSPNQVHFFLRGDDGIRNSSVYTDVDAFWSDLIAAYRREISALIAAGARYIQLDDTSIVFLCDPAQRKVMAGWGRTPEALLSEYAERINQVIAGFPADVTFTLHQCRGNREGNWVAEGGYDAVAEVLFNQIKVQGFFLEYDSPRAGSFAPLRFLPKGKTAVLGLVSTKVPALESSDDLKRRIDEAARVAPLEQLALSPQCGFASSIKGNPLTEQDQMAKLMRVVEVARAVWSDA